jgi:hypothetical protein
VLEQQAAAVEEAKHTLVELSINRAAGDLGADVNSLTPKMRALTRRCTGTVSRRETVKATRPIAREWKDPDDGRHVERSIDMRKQFGAAFEILVDDPAINARGVDFEQHEISPPPKSPIGHSADLVRIRTVDEAFRGETFRSVLPCFRRQPGYSHGSDVVQPYGHGQRTLLMEFFTVSCLVFMSLLIVVY